MDEITQEQRAFLDNMFEAGGSMHEEGRNAVAAAFNLERRDALAVLRVWMRTCPKWLTFLETGGKDDG